MAFGWNGENNGTGFDLYVKVIGTDNAAAAEHNHAARHGSVAGVASAMDALLSAVKPGWPYCGQQESGGISLCPRPWADRNDKLTIHEYPCSLGPRRRHFLVR